MITVAQLLKNNLYYKAKKQHLNNNLIIKVAEPFGNNLIVKQLETFMSKTFI